MALELPLSREKNIVLVGMPGAGKSTVGVLLAKHTARHFVDSDVLIEVREGKLLQEILDQTDYLNLRRIEEEVLLSLNLKSHVIATGGSAAYSDVAMKHLKKNGVVVFIDLALEYVKRRVHNFSTRGIACRPGITLEEVYHERYPLYEEWADVKIDCGALGHDEVVGLILDVLHLDRRLEEERGSEGKAET